MRTHACFKVEAFMKEKNIKLPADMLEIAKQCGLRLSCLNAYVACQARLCACGP